MRGILLACLLLLALYTPASDEWPLPTPIVTISAVEVSRGGTRPAVMEATAYTATGNRTSTGTWPQEGRTVAVDPQTIPYGSRLIINGQGGYIAEDSGSLVIGRIIDIYMDDESACDSWGRRDVEVIVEREE